MTTVDSLTNLVTRVLSWRFAEAASKDWALVLRRLRSVACVTRRRNPPVDHAVDWLWRSLADAPITEDMRTQARDLVIEIKGRVGAPSQSWKPSPAPRRAAL